MANNPFDEIFENKIIFDKKDLFKKGKLEETDTSEETVNSDEILTKEDLEGLVDLYNNDLKNRFTKEEAQVLNNTLEAQKEEAKKLISEIKDAKKKVYEKIKSKGDGLVLDISNRSNLKKLTIEIFNEEKNEITPEDYFVLLELRKEIMKQEASSLLESTIENV